MKKISYLLGSIVFIVVSYLLSIPAQASNELYVFACLSGLFGFILLFAAVEKFVKKVLTYLF